jgi:3-oxoacyl-[acyl-carrier-protein] synthase-1
MSKGGQTGDWRGQLAITGLGLVSPVGLTAEAATAALRAGVSRLCRIESFEIEVDEGVYDAVIGAEVPRLTRGRLGPDRLFRMLQPAFAEVIQDARIKPETRLGVYLGTSGNRPAERKLDYGSATKQALLESVPAGYTITHAKILPSGRASVLQAVRTAASAFEQNLIDVAIIGAADSWVTPRALSWLRANGKLAEFPRRTGTMPGEAAGLIALESPQHAAQRGAHAYAYVCASAGRFETVKWGEPNNAIALSQSIQSVAAGVNEPKAVVISDLSGERYRALEWVMAQSKAMWYYNTMVHWNPANCMGDTGAASGAVMLAWAAWALRKGYTGVKNILVWGASDEGAREALLLNAADNTS